MAIFIPEKLGTAGAQAVHIKRKLSQLDDAHVVRSPFPRQEWLPNFFVQHANKGWSAIAVCDTPYSKITNNGLFESSETTRFEALLKNFQSFEKAGLHAGEKPLKKLVVMWRCNTQEIQQISTRYSQSHGIYFLSREAFDQDDGQVFSRTLSAISGPQSDRLLSLYFPEAEVHAHNTTRRLFVRNSSSTLGKYFLDYNQEWAAKLDLTAPQEQVEAGKDLSLRLINGVAGSGKTLIAMARALLLAEMYPDQQVLFLIHNRPIVADLRAKLIRSRGAIPKNLEICTFFSWAGNQWKQLNGRFPNYIKPRQLPPLLARLRSAWPELTQTSEQLSDELDFINETLQESLDSYLQASRAGRGFALREKERIAMWGLYQAVTKALASPPLPTMLWSAMPHDICKAKDHSNLVLADHVLIDEAQFFAPSWFHVVRLGMQPHGSLFLCADPNQGFMKSRLSWKSVGLEVAGRTKKLYRSYRTTQAILTAANSILKQHTKADADDYLEPDMQGMEPGLPPVLIQCASVQDCIDKLINEIDAALKNHNLTVEDMLVVFGDSISKNALHQRLSRHLGEHAVWCFNLEEKKYDPPQGYRREYLRMASVGSATGLEAGVVFLIGMEKLVSSAASASLSTVADREARATATEEHARKLYMAMTRAGQSLFLLTSEPVAPAIASQFHSA
ncbi:DUF2075 domain-containing protein [Lampropedia puyangensis]|uniref:DUF2075 domain-containing protein n=1 Tax=Lampropedia puyangensis TaxID=1330072 RepID=A0A4S8EY74_9BURK|nr:DNA/RNA helicase domain-containing protein [Lampropedia puyangensis]THT99887.1 DUF2075 domain-containing protein [Lampropedia puyangensis]